MEYSAGDFQLIFDLRGGNWSMVPDYVWRSILLRFASKICSEVSFDCVTFPDEIQKLTVFNEHSRYRVAVSKFEFNEWIASLILQEPLNRWCCSNDGIHADELLFWTDGKIKLHAIPWEGIAYFNSLTLEELQLLKRCDSELQHHLYSR